MIPIVVDNVNEALPQACSYFSLTGGKSVVMASRTGKVLRAPGVFVTEFQKPWQRVLFEPRRDCNPFFHLMEAIWMLAGRNDVAFPSYFNSNFADYSDNGLHFHGAYGYRWRKWFHVDQIRHVIDMLLKDPWSRRAVIGIYSPELDLVAGDRGGKDIPCNLTVSFHRNHLNALDMTVFNRSNDLIWGAYGSNVVHFSVLHELIAGATGMVMGSYFQVSSNTHVYERFWPLVEQLAASVSPHVSGPNPYVYPTVSTHPLYEDLRRPPHWTSICDDAVSLCEAHNATPSVVVIPFHTQFFDLIARPVYQAWSAWKENRQYRTAYGFLSEMPQGNDWRLVCEEWLQRRETKDASRQ